MASAEQQAPFIAGSGSIKVDLEEGKEYHWCSCGMSKKQPFCDGSHKAFNAANGTAFKSLKFTASRVLRDGAGV